MAKLIYVANVSLDGYIEDAHGSFEWTAPIDEVFTFITDLVRPVGTYLYGRRMYETMAVWETQPALAAQSELMATFQTLASGPQNLFLHPPPFSLLPNTPPRAPLFPPFFSAKRRRPPPVLIWAGGPPRPPRSTPAGSMSASFSFIRCSSVKASPHSPATPASSWSCWRNAGSATVS